MSTIFDPTRTFRYRLTRNNPFVAQALPVLWVMLNPSDADETRNDPTIRKIRGFQGEWSKYERCGTTEVVNVFARIATKPKTLRDALGFLDIVGPDNDAHIAGAALDVLGAGGRIVVAWGAQQFARPRAEVVAASLSEVAQLWCLGVNKDGSPKHPLYVPYSQPLIPWEGYR